MATRLDGELAAFSKLCTALRHNLTKGDGLPRSPMAYPVHRQTPKHERRIEAMNKKLLFAAPLALAAGALLASPASAQSWNNNAGQLRAEIAQLDKQVDRTRGLSNREERALEKRVDRLQSLYRNYARNGFTRNEVQTLQREIASVRVALQRQSHDRNNHAGRNHRR
jgi:hypothetical protein